LRLDGRILGVGGGPSPGQARDAAVDRALKVSRAVTFVCKTSEVPQSGCREFKVGRRHVLICEYQSQFFAHSALCPHQGCSLDGARLWGDLVDCPWHHYMFKVTTGENVYPRRVLPNDRPDLLETVRSLRTFPTKVHDGKVFVEFPSRQGVRA
jgi:3-phenylpropionate/trans-cinnamate dioxygenase ferredoxin subunit